MPDYAIEFQSIHKTYVNKKKLMKTNALKDVSLAIPQGSLYGLLGPNGAGKSTLINILGGLVFKTSGRASIWGIDIDEQPEKSRMNIGIVPQELSVDPFFTPLEILVIQAGLYGKRLSKIEAMEILRVLGLEDKANSYMRELSGGMQRRVMVAKALAHKPPIVVLDEPTAGVDVNQRHQLWEYVKELNAQGTTILLTTHYLEEAQAICDQIAIIDQGKLITSKPKEELLKESDRKELIVTTENDIGTLPKEQNGFLVEKLSERQLKVCYQPSQHSFDKVLTYIQNLNVTVIDLNTKEADLEDIFLQLTASDAA